MVYPSLFIFAVGFRAQCTVMQVTQPVVMYGRLCVAFDSLLVTFLVTLVSDIFIVVELCTHVCSDQTV